MNSIVEDRSIIVTEDGSHTIFVPGLDEHYHSVFGAIQESKHVFIREGFDQIDRNEINILEIGFGTGLNALLTCIKSNNESKVVNYTAIEPFPLNKSIWSELNYPDQMDDKDARALFFKIHEAEWGREELISESFELLKIKNTLEELNLDESKYDLVYFDAFSPEVHPSLWSEDNFCKIYKAMKVGGILVTYSSKGSVKRVLRSAGFQVKRLHGPKGKHHIIRACKTVASLQ
ncbi:MAG: tRNA (5-methylaminomethyl-2-thiouridine)(34)-methyltransferase MnmD [Bacteroidales bacterium]|nr:tRNA (5-methylaminomethyl-2-thiouridine)(34)-methyltransferase MnmD [Bacteroidales bacterium]